MRSTRQPARQVGRHVCRPSAAPRPSPHPAPPPGGITFSVESADSPGLHSKQVRSLAVRSRMASAGRRPPEPPTGGGGGGAGVGPERGLWGGRRDSAPGARAVLGCGGGIWTGRRRRVLGNGPDRLGCRSRRGWPEEPRAACRPPAPAAPRRAAARDLDPHQARPAAGDPELRGLDQLGPAPADVDLGHVGHEAVVADLHVPGPLGQAAHVRVPAGVGRHRRRAVLGIQRGVLQQDLGAGEGMPLLDPRPAPPPPPARSRVGPGPRARPAAAEARACVCRTARSGPFPPVRPGNGIARAGRFYAAAADETFADLPSVPPS